MLVEITNILQEPNKIYTLKKPESIKLNSIYGKKSKMHFEIFFTLKAYFCPRLIKRKKEK
jgi:hypothetical protein